MTETAEKLKTALSQLSQQGRAEIASITKLGSGLSSG
jgi:hypothetical protein